MVIAYTVRNLMARKRIVLPTAFAVMAATAAITVMLSLVEGLFAAIYEGGHPLNAVVIGRNAVDEAASRAKLAMVNRIEAAPGIARKDGKPLVSPELVIRYKFKQGTAAFEGIAIRGVEPVALEIHPGVRVDGRFPNRNEAGLVVGAARLGKFDGLTVGGTVVLGKSEWPILGVLHAPGTFFESEVWADRSALQTELQVDTVSAIYVRLDDEAALEPLKTSVTRDETEGLTVHAERDFFTLKFQTINVFLRAIWTMALLLSFGAVFAAVNALYSTFLARQTEIATLRAIGYTRERVAVLLLTEAMTLCVGSGLLGLAIAKALDGHAMAMEGAQLAYAAAVTPRVLGAGGVAAAVIGLVGGSAIVVHSLRLKILEAFRA